MSSCGVLSGRPHHSLAGWFCAACGGRSVGAGRRPHTPLPRCGPTAACCPFPVVLGRACCGRSVGAGRRPHTPRRGIPSPRPLKRRGGCCAIGGDPGASDCRYAPRGGQRSGGAVLTALLRHGARCRTISPYRRPPASARCQRRGVRQPHCQGSFAALRMTEGGRRVTEGSAG